jgi:hypothetical protein
MKRVIVLLMILLAPSVYADTIMDQSLITPLLTDQVWMVDDPGGTPGDGRATVQSLADIIIGDLVAGDIPDISATYLTLAQIGAAYDTEAELDALFAAKLSAATIGAAYDTEAELDALFAAKEDTLTNEAGLYSALSDVSDFFQPTDDFTGTDGQLIDLSAITHTNDTNEGLILPTWANVTVVGLTSGALAWDETTDAIKVKSDAGWQSIGATAAPTDAQYLTLDTDATLSVERVLTAGAGIDFTDGGAGSTLTIDGETGTVTNPGILELATNAETATGADTARAVTPDGVQYFLDNGSFTSTGTIDLSGATVTFGLEAGDIPDISGTYEAVDAEILRADTADTIGADMEFQDNIPASFGNDNDWEIDYNTASGILAVTHTAGAAADVTFDLNDDAADSTYTITNSDGTYEADLVVEGDITAKNITIDSGDGNRILTLINNTAGNQPTTADVNTGLYSYQTDMFIVANDDIHTMFEADTGDIYLYGATGDSGYEYQIDITDPTADRTITLDNNNVDLSHTTEDYVLKYNASTRTWSGEADSTGAGSLGSNLSSSTNDIVSDNNSIELESNSEDIDFEFTTNTVTLTSDTGVTLFDFGTINLGTDALDLSEGNIANVGTIALDAINADSTNVIFGSAAATQLQFRDSAIHIASADDGHLDLTADTSIDLNGTVVVSGTLDQNEDVDIDFNASDEEVVITNSAEYGAGGAQVTIDNSDADVGAQMYLLDLDYSADDGQANADYIIAQDSGGTVWVLGQDGDIATTDGDFVSTNGAVTAGGTVTGGTVTDGTVTLAGDGTITGVSVGGLPDNIVDNGMMADNAIGADELADADLGDVVISSGAATVVNVALDEASDFGDVDVTSVDKLEGVDAGVYIDLGADGVTEIQSDTTVQIGASDENLQITDGGTNLITIGTGSGVTEINTTLQFATTGDIMGGINISSKSGAYTVGTDDAHESYGTLFVATGAADLTLPSAVAGMSICLMQGQGNTSALTIQPNTGDYLVVDGARETAATDYVSTGAADEKICVAAADATDWYVTSIVGTWSE